MAKPFAWSYSALTRYENCPKQYYHINVVKDVKDEFGSAQGNDGDLIHKALFARVTKGSALPVVYRQYERIAKKFADASGEKHGELKWAVNREFQPCGYFDPDVYIRIIIDLLIVDKTTAVLVDWKTGKVKPDFGQLALSAAIVAQYMPEVELFKTAYVWVNYNNISPKTYTRHELKAVWADLIPRATRIENAIKTTDFPAKQSGLCRYCPVRQCPHNTKED